jgi:hypothetical protein
MQLNELLEQAIESRKAIRFCYSGSDGAHGPRVGSPHALYVHPNTRKISCDIHQHHGDSATGNMVPFKPFNLAKMFEVCILDSEDFRRYVLYDADAPRYVNSIKKIP